jgi:hypothetical protein
MGVGWAERVGLQFFSPDTSLKPEQHQLVALTRAVVRHEMYIGSLEREREWCFLVLYLLCTGWVGFFDCHSHTKYWFFLFSVVGFAYTCTDNTASG